MKRCADKINYGTFTSLRRRFINQKLNYLHDNPCRGKWNLAESPMDYIHSSARFYLTGEQGVYEVYHAGMLEDID